MPLQTIIIMTKTLRQREPLTGLNPMQLHLLSILNFNTTPSSEERLKKALQQFYLAEFERMKDELWENGTLTEEKIEEHAHDFSRSQA